MILFARAPLGKPRPCIFTTPYHLFSPHPHRRYPHRRHTPRPRRFPRSAHPFVPRVALLRVSTLEDNSGGFTTQACPGPFTLLPAAPSAHMLPQHSPHRSTRPWPRRSTRPRPRRSSRPQYPAPAAAPGPGPRHSSRLRPGRSTRPRPLRGFRPRPGRRPRPRRSTRPRRSSQPIYPGRTCPKLIYPNPDPNLTLIPIHPNLIYPNPDLNRP